MRIKTQGKQVLPNTSAHHPLPNARPIPEQSQLLPAKSVSLLDKKLCVWNVPLGSLGCPGHGPSQLLIHLLIGRA